MKVSSSNTHGSAKGKIPVKFSKQDRPIVFSFHRKARIESERAMVTGQVEGSSELLLEGLDVNCPQMLSSI